MNKFFLGLLLVLSVPLAAPLVSAADNLTAGTDYEMVVPPLPGETDGKAEVIEFFWYGCPHCSHFEPSVRSWAANLPDNIHFVRVPAVFNNPTWKLHAQAFYTAEVLGIMDKFHPAMFAAWHEQKRHLITEDQLQAFFAELGVSEEDFRKTFNSFAVQTKVRRAADLTKRSGIDGVPTIMVNGKFRVNGTLAGSYERMLSITEDLAKMEAKSQAVAKSPD